MDKVGQEINLICKKCNLETHQEALNLLLVKELRLDDSLM